MAGGESDATTLRAAVDKHQFAGRRIMAHPEKVLDSRVAQKGFRVRALRKFDDDHAVGLPIALDRLWFNTPDDVFSRMPCDVRGYFSNVCHETTEVIHREVEHQIRFHS